MPAKKDAHKPTRIVCISASNIKHAKNWSTSTKICCMIKEMILQELEDHATIDIIPLADYELKPCIGCGECFKSGTCAHDEAFNRIMSFLTRADGIVFVSAHYAPIPSKLTMLLEKIEQLAFLPRFNDATWHSPLYKKPVALIGHGGGTKETLPHYKKLVLDIIENALSWPVEMQIVEIDETQPNGVVFPVKQVKKDPNSIFPIQEYDWNNIQHRIEPLITNLLKAVATSYKRSL
jgi:hypothetical protein